MLASVIDGDPSLNHHQTNILGIYLLNIITGASGQEYVTSLLYLITVQYNIQCKKRSMMIQYNNDNHGHLWYISWLSVF